MKKCCACKQIRGKSAFPQRGDKTGLTSECRDCLKKRQDKYRKNNRELIRKRWNEYYSENKREVKSMALKWKYGITMDDFEMMFYAQDEKCAGCKLHHTKFTKGLAIDHCHKTGKIRGLLCVNCNRCLGLAKDNIQTLSNLIIYLGEDT